MSKLTEAQSDIKCSGPTVEPPMCGCCYCLVVLIITAVLVVVSIILVIVHFCRRGAKKEGNVYWVINVCLILIGLACFVLAILQILYLECVIACTDLSLCSDKAGRDASIAFIVLGFIAVVYCIVLFVIRYKQRVSDQSKETNNTEMKPGPENGTEKTSQETNNTNKEKDKKGKDKTSQETNNTNKEKETNGMEKTSQETNNANQEKETNGMEKTKNGTSVRPLPKPKIFLKL